VARLGGETKGAYRILVRKPEGREPLGRHKLKWEDNIKVDLKKHRIRTSGRILLKLY